MIRRVTLACDASALIPPGERVTSMLAVPNVFRPHKVMLAAGWELRRVRCANAEATFVKCPSDVPGFVNAYLVSGVAMTPGQFIIVDADNSLDVPQEWLGFKVRGAEAVPWEAEKSGAV